jgi:tight adherence protein B
MKQDYSQYHLSKKEFFKYILQSVFLCVLIDYLFYQNWWLLFAVIPVSAGYLKYQKKRLVKERRKRLNYQFKDALNALSVAVQAGYSIENAVSACARDLERLYEKGTDILEEFHYIESQRRLSVPVEELFLDFGMRSQVEDIENFASVFYTAKRTGGDMDKVIQKVARMLGDKIDVKKEIETTLAAKKSEQLIMSLMPAGIILYLQLTSPGFLNVLYGNLFGFCAMTICLGIYVTAYWLGTKIVDIEV